MSPNRRSRSTHTRRISIETRRLLPTMTNIASRPRDGSAGTSASGGPYSGPLKRRPTSARCSICRAERAGLRGDISLQMMREAARSPQVEHADIAGYVQADAEQLPFRDRSLDCVVSIRFMFHVDPITRRRMLREMGRISTRWLIIDYRHKYSARWVSWRVRHAFGLLDQVPERVSRSDLQSEFRDAGLTIRRVIPVRCWLSDKWIVLAESTHDQPAFEPALAEERLRGTDLEGVKITGKFGEGRRSIVYRARWQDRDIALKVRHPRTKKPAADRRVRVLAQFQILLGTRSRSLRGATPGVCRHAGGAGRRPGSG